ncbi:MAG: phage holin family protein [Acetobacteraceae bacterium]
MDDVSNGRSLRDIVADVAQDAQQLVRGELALARVELDRKIERAIVALVWVFGGMFVGFAGLIVLLMAAVDALTYVIPAWAAALVIGVVIVAIGGFLGVTGVRMLSLTKLVPWRVTRSVGKDAHMVREHI